MILVSLYFYVQIPYWLDRLGRIYYLMPNRNSHFSICNKNCYKIILFSDLQQFQNLTVKTTDTKVHINKTFNCIIKLEYMNVFSANDLSTSRKNGN